MKKFDREHNLALRSLIGEHRKACEELLSRETQAPGSTFSPRGCPVCGSCDRQGSLNNGHISYDKCAVCGLWFMNPALHDEIVEAGFSADDPCNQAYWQLMGGRIRQHEYPIPPDPNQHPILRDLVATHQGGRLLDIGCSVGNFLAAAQHYFEVEGLEINPETARIAQERGFKVHACPIEQLPETQTYDVVTMNQLLYGLKHPMQLLRAVTRHLNPGGILYINTPNGDSLAMGLYGGKHCHLHGKVNLNLFTQSSLHRAAEKLGLEVDSFYTEWLNLYTLDMLLYLVNKSRFVHRLNAILPGYEPFCQFDEWIQAKLTKNRFKRRGEYCVCIMKKPV